MSKKKTEQDEQTKVNTEETTEDEVTAPEKAEKAEEPKDETAEKIKSLEDETAAWKDKYMRLAAEYDNYRKRTSNEKLSIYDDATAKAVTELLPVADSVTMALANLKDADPEIIKGIELISNQLVKSFEKLKVEAYGEIGDDFDPNLHNAISKVDSEELGENKLAAVFQKGYKIGDKVIRHAMVQVANCD
jgi:molecular chaperone GrpE